MSASKDKSIGFDRLIRRIDGRLITPSDEDYASNSRLFYPMVTEKPAAVVRVAGAGDISAVIGEAASRGLELWTCEAAATVSPVTAPSTTGS